MEGTNRNDLSDYRPGLRALHELNIRSPLLETGLDKETVRKLAREKHPRLEQAGLRLPAHQASTWNTRYSHPAQDD